MIKSKLSAQDISELLKEKGLNPKGRKSQLVDRYFNSLQSSLDKPTPDKKSKPKSKKYSLSELKKALSDFGLSIKGKKDILIKRLENALGE